MDHLGWGFGWARRYPLQVIVIVPCSFHPPSLILYQHFHHHHRIHIHIHILSTSSFILTNLHACPTSGRFSKLNPRPPSDPAAHPSSSLLPVLKTTQTTSPPSKQRPTNYPHRHLPISTSTGPPFTPPNCPISLMLLPQLHPTTTQRSV